MTGPGTLLVYSFNYEQAAQAGLIDPAELKNKKELLQQLAEVVRKRVDTTGEAKVQVLPQGDHKLQLMVPGKDEDRLAQIKGLMQNPGLLEFAIVASEEDGIDLAAERAKFESWLEANPAKNPPEFNHVAASAGGPLAEIRWIPIREEEQSSGLVYGAVRDSVPLLVQDRLRTERAGTAAAWDFHGQDLQYVGPTVDELGQPAVAFEFQEDRKAAFSDFTEAYINRAMAIVINQQVYSAPNINSRLPGGGIIMGGTEGFSLAERDELIAVLRSGHLRVLPELLSETPVLAK